MLKVYSEMPGREYEDLATNVRDLLCDLMHHCEFRGVDFDDQLRIAKGHWEVER